MACEAFGVTVCWLTVKSGLVTMTALVQSTSITASWLSDFRYLNWYCQSKFLPRTFVITCHGCHKARPYSVVHLLILAQVGQG